MGLEAAGKEGRGHKGEEMAQRVLGELLVGSVGAQCRPKILALREQARARYTQLHPEVGASSSSSSSLGDTESRTGASSSKSKSV